MVASGSVIVEDITEHEHAPGHTDGDGVLGRYRGQPRRIPRYIFLGMFEACISFPQEQHTCPGWGIQHLGKQWENRWGTGETGKRKRGNETGKQPELRDFSVRLPAPLSASPANCLLKLPWFKNSLGIFPLVSYSLLWIDLRAPSSCAILEAGRTSSAPFSLHIRRVSSSLNRCPRSPGIRRPIPNWRNEPSSSSRGSTAIIGGPARSISTRAASHNEKRQTNPIFVPTTWNQSRFSREANPFGPAQARLPS